MRLGERRIVLHRQAQVPQRFGGAIFVQQQASEVVVRLGRGRRQRKGVAEIDLRLARIVQGQQHQAVIDVGGRVRRIQAERVEQEDRRRLRIAGQAQHLGGAVQYLCAAPCDPVRLLQALKRLGIVASMQANEPGEVHGVDVVRLLAQHLLATSLDLVQRALAQQVEQGADAPG